LIRILGVAIRRRENEYRTMRVYNKYGILLALSALILAACVFRSHRPVYRFDSGKTYRVHYSVELKAKAGGNWGSDPYASVAQAEFSFRAVPDTSKGEIELSLAVDSLTLRNSERGPEEDGYMAGRLKKYLAKMVISRTGQVLSLDEEPSLPPVGFSTLNFSRSLIYSLASFPDRPVKQGSRWEITQSLLDKFHPESRIVKRFALSAIRETPEGRLAVCLVELEAYLVEELGEFGESISGTQSGGDASRYASGKAASPRKPSLTGRGSMVFNLDKGLPVSADLELGGEFRSLPPSIEADSSRPSTSVPESMILDLQEKISLRFTD